jgi:L-malate glycosyltransferase
MNVGHRITYLLPNFSDHPIGGYKVHYQHAIALAEHGHKVTVVHPVTDRKWPKAPDFIRYVKLATRQQRSKQSLVTWFEFQANVDLRIVPRVTGGALPAADITILTAWQTAERTVRPAGRAGPLVQIVYDYEFWMEHPERRERMRAALTRRDVTYVATSSVVAEMLVELGTEPFATVTAGLAENEFGIDEPIEARGDLVAFPLRTGTAKDMGSAFKAAEIIRSTLPQVRVQCFGSSPADTVPSEVQALGRLNHPELRALYNRCAVFMLTSKYEGWGLPAAEAMACGAAVVSTRNGGTEDFLIDGRNGLLVPVSDPTAIAEAIIRLLRDGSERSRLASAGAEDMRPRTVRHSALALNDVLDAIVQSASFS